MGPICVQMRLIHNKIPRSVLPDFLQSLRMVLVFLENQLKVVHVGKWTRRKVRTEHKVGLLRNLLVDFMDVASQSVLSHLALQQFALLLRILLIVSLIEHNEIGRLRNVVPGAHGELQQWWNLLVI